EKDFTPQVYDWDEILPDEEKEREEPVEESVIDEELAPLESAGEEELAHPNDPSGIEEESFEGVAKKKKTKKRSKQ
ncbi:MAG TPA: hypothetical protein DDZ91_14430, partial [Firmicutes bacterium]|nr:hypothetical protein [Bacillota bacterium]